MAEPYRIYHMPSRVNSACNYYRMVLPFTAMEKQGLPVSTIPLGAFESMGQQFQTACFMESDFNIQWQPTSQTTKAYMEIGKKLHPKRDENGVMRYPPTFVIDCDDDLFNVNPLNVSYGAFGIRHSDGTPLVEGDGVGIAHPLQYAPGPIQAKLNKIHPNPLIGDKEVLDGDKYIFDRDGMWHAFYQMWRDGENFDLRANQGRVANFTACVKMANLVTCSTPRVAEALKREIDPNLPTFVTPNAIDFSEYPEIELSDHPGEIRMLWEGAANHHEGLWKLNPALQEVMEKYPNVTLYFFGAPYNWAKENLPAERVKMVPWVEYDAYKLRLSTLNHDISLAPLAPTLFNASRSANRWYESSALCKPAATIAQKWAGFADEIKDGENGMLFENNEEFVAKLSKLIEDASLRQNMAANAKEWVKEHRDPRRVAVRLFNKLVEVREEQKLNTPIVEDSAEETPVEPPVETPEPVSADAS